jgi:hypothetical protein
MDYDNQCSTFANNSTKEVEGTKLYEAKEWQQMAK